jgi:hypothetical protein
MSETLGQILKGDKVELSPYQANMQMNNKC